MVKFFYKDVNPFNEKIRALPDVPPLTVGLSSDQVSTNLLNFSCENFIAKDNSVKLFDSLANVIEIL
jgi:hypothetical protein